MRDNPIPTVGVGTVGTGEGSVLLGLGLLGLGLGGRGLLAGLLPGGELATAEVDGLLPDGDGADDGRCGEQHGADLLGQGEVLILFREHDLLRVGGLGLGGLVFHGFFSLVFGSEGGWIPHYARCRSCENMTSPKTLVGALELRLSLLGGLRGLGLGDRLGVGPGPDAGSDPQRQRVARDLSDRDDEVVHEGLADGQVGHLGTGELLEHGGFSLVVTMSLHPM